MMREMPDVERVGEIVEIGQFVGNLELSGQLRHFNTSKAYLPVDIKRHRYNVYTRVWRNVWSSEDSSRRIADLAGMDMATDDLHYLELTELAARITARKISPQDVTRAL